MKSGWKWNFIGGLAILATIGSAVIFMIFVGSILPWAQADCQQLNVPLPKVLDRTSAAVQLLLSDDAWRAWALIALFIVGWAVFEWRVRSENKHVIRLAAGTAVALLTTVATFWVGFATVMGVWRVSYGQTIQDPRPAAVAKLEDARTDMSLLSRAIGTKDWAVAHDASSDLWLAVRGLRSKLQATALVAARTPDAVDKVARILDELDTNSYSVMNGASPYFQPEYIDARTRDRFTKLSKTWNALCKEVRCESTDGAPTSAPAPANAE